MPAHIYYRLGRWRDSIRVNVDAARADEAYIKATRRQGPRPLRLLSAQRPLHRHLGANGRRHADRDPRGAQAGATCSTRRSARRSRWIQAINAAPYFAAAQFASPGADPGDGARPTRGCPIPTAMRHYARAVGLRAASATAPGSSASSRALTALRETRRFQADDRSGRAGAGAAAARRNGRARRAGPMPSRRLRRGGAPLPRGDRDRGQASPTWSRPGGIIRCTSRSARRCTAPASYDEARDAFTAALARSPNNGWALYGLAASEQALGQQGAGGRRRGSGARPGLGRQSGSG